jgi:hypothetical protein
LWVRVSLPAPSRNKKSTYKVGAFYIFQKVLQFWNNDNYIEVVSPWLFIKIYRLYLYNTVLMNASNWAAFNDDISIVDRDGTVWKAPTEREKSLRLTESYKLSIIFLITKIQWCIDLDWVEISDLKKLALSSLDSENIVFRSGAKLKIEVPNSLNKNELTLAQIDNLLDQWTVEINGTEIDDTTWTSHKLSPYIVRDNTVWLSEAVQEEVKDIIAVQKSKDRKDRSLRWKGSRLYDKLMGVSGTDSRKDLPVLTKIHLPDKSRGITISIKRKNI